MTCVLLEQVFAQMKQMLDIIQNDLFAKEMPGECPNPLFHRDDLVDRPDAMGV